MAETTTDVLVGGYPNIDEAMKDFDALAKLVEGKKVEMEAAILITHAKDGTVTVAQTADHRGRKGVEWGGGVGVLVGLAAPPLLAVTAAGAVAGGLVGKFVDKRLETEMHDKIGENLPPGTAGIIAAFDDSQRLAVEQALPGALAKSIVQTDKKGMKALKDGLAEAMGKFVPGPHGAADPGQELRRHDRADDRPVGPRLDDHPRPEGAAGRAERPAHPHRRRRVRPARHVRRADRHSEHDPRREEGPHLQPLPRRRALLAHEGGDAHRAQPAPRRHGLGRGVPRPVPGLHRRRAAHLRAVPARPARQRLRDRRLRQVAHDPGPRAGRGRPVRPLAELVGVHPLLGLPQRRRRPVGSADHGGQHERSACPRAPTGSRTTSRTT